LSFGFARANTVVLYKIYASVFESYLFYVPNILFNAGPVIHSYTFGFFNFYNICYIYFLF
jgi:hypothetical protein